MPRNQIAPQKSIAYFFSRSKDVHEEDGVKTITLYARLTREFTYKDDQNIFTKVQTVWVDIEDIKMEEATEKMKELPNAMQEYTLTEEVFRMLYQLSKSCPRELYFVTPLHQGFIRQKFIALNHS